MHFRTLFLPLVFALAACGSSASPSDEPSSAGPCGGATCTADEFCADPTQSCRTESDGGARPVCLQKPAKSACDGQSPVCGCDGKVYDNSCVAALAGVDSGSTTACKAPAGFFACSEVFCPEGDLCISKQATGPHGELLGGTISYCATVPAACASTPTCECLLMDNSDPFKCITEIPSCSLEGTHIIGSCNY